MLRRSSILSICFLSFLALFALTAEGQTHIYHIGILPTLENGQPNPAYQPDGTVNGNNYYFDSLQSLKKTFPTYYYFLQKEGSSVELRLYSDQVIPNPSETGDFYSIWTELSTTKNVWITSVGGTKTISIPDNEQADADFLRMNSSNLKVNLNMSNVRIKAGSSTSSNRYATSVFGGNFSAEGVTYFDGGSVFVTNSGNLHSIVNLNGTAFVGNSASPASNDAILSLNNISSVDLSNTTFTDNNAKWQVYVFTDSSTYSSPPNINIQLGATEEGTVSILGNADDSGGGIFLGGNVNSDTSYTVNINGDGDFYQNQKIVTDEQGNYSLIVNKLGSGTWYVADGITNEFKTQGTNTTMNINGGTLEMGKNSGFEVSGNETTFHLTDSTLNMGSDSVFDVQGRTLDVRFENSTLNIGEGSEFKFVSINNWPTPTIYFNESIVNLEKDAVMSLRGDQARFQLVSSLEQSNTLNMGENSKIIVNSENLSDISFAFANVTMGRGSQLITTVDSVGTRTIDFFETTVTLKGNNFVQSQIVGFAGVTFKIDAETLKLSENSQPVLTLNADILGDASATFDIYGVHSNIVHQELARNIGTGTFTINNIIYKVLLDGQTINTILGVPFNNRASAAISGSADSKSLYLDVTFDNKILRWTGMGDNTWDLVTYFNNNSKNWRYEEENSQNFIETGYIFSDAVVFDDLSPRDYTINVLQSGVYISQQNGYLTDIVPNENGDFEQHFVTEYGMRVSGTHNWTFNNGSINDDFNPDPAATFIDQKKHVARLTFDGTGTLRLNNTDANKFHDGLLIGNNISISQMSVARPDSLGSGEYAGEITDIDDPNNNKSGNKYVVQHEGYGIMFVGKGGNIQIDNGNGADGNVLDQRIFVQQGTNGTLAVTDNTQETIVTASDSYYNNRDNFDTPIIHGGVIVVESGATFTMTGNFHFKDNNKFVQQENFDGGVLWAGVGTSVTVNGNSYSKNAARENGGAVYLSGGTNAEGENAKWIASDSLFYNNIAKYGGAVYINDTTNVDLSNTEFKFNGVVVQEILDDDGNPIEVADFNNVITQQGGVIYAKSGSNFVTDNQENGSRFIQNGAVGDGGAIFIGDDTRSSSLAIQNAQFSENVSKTGSGGAIYSTKTKIIGDNTVFDGNIAGQSGGALYVNAVSESEPISLAETTFRNNEAIVSGGAIYLNPAANNAILNISQAYFINNLTHSNDSQGGAIFAGGTGIRINGTRSVFQNNMVGENKTGKGYQGGAVYLGDNGTLNMASSTFQGNRVNVETTESQGGAIYTGTGANITLSNGLLEKNIAYADGGAIYSVGNNNTNNNGTLTINGTNFISNQSENANGGAIFTGYTIINADEAVFSENIADKNGGALFISGVNKETSFIDLKNVQFDQNDAENGSGGAIYLDATGYAAGLPDDNYQLTLDVSGTKFLTNAAQQDGGAIYAKTNTIVNVKTLDNGLAWTVFGVADAKVDEDEITDGNKAERNGGAIYINGEQNQKATSQLDVDGAVFEYNIAGENGGAVYLRYADAEIANAAFTGNIATRFGGGIYYENENGKELKIKNVQFSENQATSGGAVYLVNPTTLNISDTNFSNNQVSGNGDGGAIYFNSGNSTLDITGTTFQNNTATGSGGAVRLQNNSAIKADKVNFSDNKAASGGAVKIGNIADIQIAGSTFYHNVATNGNGGAIEIDDKRTTNLNPDEMNRLNITSTNFSHNISETGSGGAVYVSNAVLNTDSVTFSNNSAAQNGGALYAENSDLNLKNTAFTGNETDQKGSAIYFLTTNNQNREIIRKINLETSDNKSGSFTGNRSNGNIANSIYFDGQGTNVTNILLNVTTGANTILNMTDPMYVDDTNQKIELAIVKNGDGKWSLGGSNDFTKTEIGTTIVVNGGTFELQNGAELLLTNTNIKEDNVTDHFQLNDGATFATVGLTDSASQLRTTSLDFAAGSKMQLGGNLELNIGNDYTISSTLSGNGGFTKEDSRTLNFRGNTNNYNGNVVIKEGELNIIKDPDNSDSGRFVTQNGSFEMAPNTVLRVNADSESPTIVAKSVTIDRVDLNIGGISGDDTKEFILIHTTNGIIGNFNTINGDTENSYDYLTFNLGFLNNRNDYGGTIGLRWYSKDDELKASGRFTVNDYFNVGMELYDNKTNLSSNWTGTTLDKYGLGTLELSGTNTYTGKTTIHEGELLLSNKQGTGLGNAAVEVQKNARLGLNFDGTYTKKITGAGQVVQYGGTVELTRENTYTGGTVLKNGIMEFTANNQFGTAGSITFDGGTLRNKAETSLARSIVIVNGKNALFDTPLFNSSKNSLEIKGTIKGNGGLEKTGEGILALTGTNTFTGTSYVQNGGLKIDGSVTSDVRVQAFAAVSGTGSILSKTEEKTRNVTGGDLFISRDGYFDWYFSPQQSKSEPLNVEGSVYLADGAIFRPRTDPDNNFTDQIVGWTVLKYGKTLGGQFSAIDDTFNPFYDFELDYSVPNEIRVNGELLTHPKALGDVITTGLSIANRKLYRKPFAELLRETMYRKTVNSNVNATVRGQAIQPTRSIWFAPTARANRFASTFVGGTYDFEAYGMQTGSTLWSNNNSSLGLMIGYERGALRNRLDWIRSHDYEIGLYYGRIFRTGSEFRGFIGGGFQTFTASRNDTVETYMTKYDGSSFEINAEFGKLFAGKNGTLFRPYFAADIEYSGQTAAQENEIGNAFRHYGRADLSQFFVRLGADIEKRWQYVDLNGGLSYTGLLFGQTRAKAPIFYPTRDAGTTSYGARLGRSSWTLKTGLNWHLNRQRMNTIFLDYYADLYMDRAGDTVQHSGNLGILVRF
ncbi:MAG: autotransporter-associated beta strand repeat-containing protein [Planctomycetaceae bacterium]|jgi:autotransporter-associated beta strand protein/predicted outer membrane repeat protein|nr:autotransporter-associated beta strand repeat-containing protein [Planctomycetaceae bacterium]